MTDKEEKELLTDVLKALFGPQLKGKYIVEFRGSMIVDADDRGEAIKIAKKIVKTDPDKVSYNAIKLDSLVE